MNFKITNLGQLKTIGRDVYLTDSKLNENDFENVITKNIYK